MSPRSLFKLDDLTNPFFEVFITGFQSPFFVVLENDFPFRVSENVFDDRFSSDVRIVDGFECVFEIDDSTIGSLDTVVILSDT